MPTIGEKPAREVEADEPGNAGDKNGLAHGRASCCLLLYGLAASREFSLAAETSHKNPEGSWTVVASVHAGDITIRYFPRRRRSQNNRGKMRRSMKCCPGP